MRGLIGLVVGIVVAVAGCSGDGTDTADPTVPTAVSTSSTTTAAAPDVSVIPENIDEPYLNAVLAALDQVNGDAVRIIQRTKRLPPDAADRLNAIYADQRFETLTTQWFEELAADPELKGLKPNPGNRKTTVRRVITSSPTCVFIAVERDLSATATSTQVPITEYIALRPLDRANDPKGFNPTAWMMTVDGFNPDGSEPENPCSARP